MSEWVNEWIALHALTAAFKCTRLVYQTTIKTGNIGNILKATQFEKRVKVFKKAGAIKQIMDSVTEKGKSNKNGNFSNFTILWWSWIRRGRILVRKKGPELWPVVLAWSVSSVKEVFEKYATGYITNLKSCLRWSVILSFISEYTRWCSDIQRILAES